MPNVNEFARLSACAGKIRFDSWRHARQGIRPRLCKELSAYPCEHCGGWHVGAHPNKRRKPKPHALEECEECDRSYGPHYTGPCEH